MIFMITGGASTDTPSNKSLPGFTQGSSHRNNGFAKRKKSKKHRESSPQGSSQNNDGGGFGIGLGITNSMQN